MTADPTAPASPHSPRRRLFGPAFWLFLVFGAVCLTAGWLAGTRGAPDMAAERRVSAPRAPRTASATPRYVAPPSTPADGPDAGGLAARVARLEADQARTARAAAASLAAASLGEAAESPAGFAQVLTAAEAVLPPSADVVALRRLSQVGAPTRSALAASYPDAAARAAAAARVPAEESGLLASVSRAFARLVSVRRTGDVAGSGPDALLARAEARLGAGDLDGALEQLAGLPAPARDAMARWLNQAERRAAVDRHVAAVRAQALQELTAVSHLPAAPEDPAA